MSHLYSNLNKRIRQKCNILFIQAIVKFTWKKKVISNLLFNGGREETLLHRRRGARAVRGRMSTCRLILCLFQPTGGTSQFVSTHQSSNLHEKRRLFLTFFLMVGGRRLELLHIAALDPKSSASTNFATRPYLRYLIVKSCWSVAQLVSVVYQPLVELDI